jgi:two-component system response regulator PilR (NtrC family)
MAPAGNPVVLIVDDEPDICELLAITLEGMQIASRTAHDLAQARRELASGELDLCLTDMRLPDGDGLELVDWMQTHADGIPVAVITAHGNVESAVQALKLGAFDFVSKPVDLTSLRKLVSSALKLKRERRPVGTARLLGRSPAMQRLRQMIAKVSRSQAPVHISGESGTGKELVARLIHESGPRADRAFVPVNCGAIPGELMESELFGHRKGSFTGAVADKAGLFRTADGGTLFLDEIADLPLHMQVKLLRAIQEKAVRPVGEEREQAVDVRVLSATHKDLSQLVAEGRFREDLYYRINVIELRVPALRERGDDVLLLAEHVLGRLAEDMAREKPALSESARAALLAYHFPGNVRELENVLERAITLSSGGVIQGEEIELRSQPAGERRGSERLGQQLEDIEREAIRDALERTHYNKTEAAKLLGMTFRQLRYRIKKLGLD